MKRNKTSAPLLQQTTKRKPAPLAWMLAVSCVVAFAISLPPELAYSEQCIDNQAFDYGNNGTSNTLDVLTQKSNAVTFDSGASALRLNYIGGQFSLANYSFISAMSFAATADFNKDGFADYVAAPLKKRCTTPTSNDCTTAAPSSFKNDSPSSVYLFMNTTKKSTQRNKLTSGTCGESNATYAIVTEAVGTPWTQFSTQSLTCNFDGQTQTVKNYEDPKQYIIPDFNHGSANNVSTAAGFALPYPAGQTEPAHTGDLVRSLFTGDFNGDTWPDVAVIGSKDYVDGSHSGKFLYAKIWLNRGATCGHDDNSANWRLCPSGPYAGQSRFEPAYDALASGFDTTKLDYIGWGTKTTATGNFNNEDSFADVLVGVNPAGNTNASSDTGKIAKLLNNVQLPQPKFVFNSYLQFVVGGVTSENVFKQADLFAHVSSGNNLRSRVPVFAIGDFNNDNKQDIVVGAPGVKGMRSFSGQTELPTVFTADSIQPSDSAVETSFADVPTTCSLASAYTNSACVAFPNSNARQGYSLFSGSVTGVSLADMDLDGDLDVVLATDGAVGVPRSYGLGTPVAANRTDGGQVFLFKNTNTAPGTTSFSSALSMSAVGRATTATADYDVLIVADYDSLNNTPDILAYDGNNSGSTTLIPNRVRGTTYPECGWTVSDIVDLSVLGNGEYAARRVELDATGVGLGSDDQFQLWVTNTPVSPVNPQNPIGVGTWVQTERGTGPLPDGNGCAVGSFCADFEDLSGHDLRWAAQFCSYDNFTKTPKLTSLTMDFTFEEATEIAKGGTIESNGVIFQGSYTNPGLRGKLYAVNAGFSTNDPNGRLWEASEKLGTRTQARDLFTASAAGGMDSVGNPAGVNAAVLTGMRFDEATIGPMWSYLGVANQTQATTLVGWMKSKRFGVAGERSMLGAITEATPAMMQPPASPQWYSSGTQVPESTRTKFDQFKLAKAQRVSQVLVGSLNGFLSSYYVKAPFNGSNNGYELWGYMPTSVLQGAYGDCIQSSSTNPQVCAATQGIGELSISNYVSGSVTLADVLDPTASSLFKTVAIIGGGSGGTNYTYLELSHSEYAGKPGSTGYDSVDAGWQPGDTVNGPIPKWQFDPMIDLSVPAAYFPGMPVEWMQFFGWATHKAVIARVSIHAKKSYVYTGGGGGGSGFGTVVALNDGAINDPFVCKERTTSAGTIVTQPAPNDGNTPEYFSAGEREESIVILAGSNSPQVLANGMPPTGHPKTVNGSGTAVPAGETAMSDELDQWWERNEGRGVTARRASDGKTMWRWLTLCPVSSDPVLFTQVEPDQIARRVGQSYGGRGGTPGGGGGGAGSADYEAVETPEAWKGYVNRMAIFDSCGYGYIINPAVELDIAPEYTRANPWFTWLNYPGHHADIGAVTGVRMSNCNGAVDPAEWGAWFSTAREFGHRVPVSGTIAAKTVGADEKTFLFFGTGGFNSAGKDADFADGAPNYIYAVDTSRDMGMAGVVGSGGVPTAASLASPFVPAAGTTGSMVHTKISLADPSLNAMFRSFGGVIVSDEQAIFSVSVAHVGCDDPGWNKLIAMDLALGTDDPFAITESEERRGAVYGSIYGSGTAVYFATVSGEINRIGEAAGQSGGGSGSGGSGYAGGTGLDMGPWAQIF